MTWQRFLPYETVAEDAKWLQSWAVMVSVKVPLFDSMTKVYDMQMKELAITKARIEQAWGARLFDHTGATEVGAHGFTCVAQSGVHLNEGEFLVEVINPQTLEPAGEGELVLTNLGVNAPDDDDWAIWFPASISILPRHAASASDPRRSVPPSSRANATAAGVQASWRAVVPPTEPARRP